MKVIAGSGDIIAMLEETMEHARKGEIDALALVIWETDGGCITAHTWRDDTHAGWAKLVAGAQLLAHELMGTDEVN